MILFKTNLKEKHAYACLAVLNWCKYSATTSWNKCWGWKSPHEQDIRNKIYTCSILSGKRKICCNKTLRLLVFVHGTLALWAPNWNFHFSMPDTELFDLLLIFFITSFMLQATRVCLLWIALRCSMDFLSVSINEVISYNYLQLPS